MAEANAPLAAFSKGVSDILGCWCRINFCGFVTFVNRKYFCKLLCDGSEPTRFYGDFNLAGEITRKLMNVKKQIVPRL